MTQIKPGPIHDVSAKLIRGFKMTVSIQHEGEIAVVTVNNPPVDALGQVLRQGLWDAVGMLDADPSVRAVVLICEGRTFIAGADVTEFGKPPTPPHLPASWTGWNRRQSLG